MQIREKGSAGEIQLVDLLVNPCVDNIYLALVILVDYMSKQTGQNMHAILKNYSVKECKNNPLMD